MWAWKWATRSRFLETLSLFARSLLPAAALAPSPRKHNLLIRQRRWALLWWPSIKLLSIVFRSFTLETLFPAWYWTGHVWTPHNKTDHMVTTKYDVLYQCCVNVESKHLHFRVTRSGKIVPGWNNIKLVLSSWDLSCLFCPKQCDSSVYIFT